MAGLGEDRAEGAALTSAPTILIFSGEPVGVCATAACGRAASANNPILRGDKAAWKIVDAHADSVRAVTVERPAPDEVNTWEQYEATLRALSG